MVLGTKTESLSNKQSWRRLNEVPTIVFITSSILSDSLLYVPSEGAEAELWGLDIHRVQLVKDCRQW